MPGEPDVDQILDGGAVGFRYFELALERYNRYFGDFPYRKKFSDLEAAYDMQRGLKLTKLQNVAETLQKALADTEEPAQTQRNAVGAVGDSWHSPAATAAKAALGSLVDKADHDRTMIRQAQQQIEKCIPELRRCIQEKSKFLAGLDVGHAAGAEMNGPGDQVSVIISAAKEDWGWHEDEVVQRAVDALPGMPAELRDRWMNITADSRNSSSAGRARVRTEIVKLCKSWLATSFKNEVDGKVATFDKLCIDTDNAVGKFLGNLGQSLNVVEGGHYPASSVPAGLPPVPNVPNSPPPPDSPPPPGVSPPSGGGGGGPSGGGGGMHAAAVGSPTLPEHPAMPVSGATGGPAGSSTVPAGAPMAEMTEGVMGSMKSALGEVGKNAKDLLGPGVKAAGDQLEAGLRAVAGQSGPGGLPVQAEFDLFGNHVKIVQEPGGGVSMQTVGPDGKPHSYKLEFKDGKPVLTETTPPPAEPQPAPKPQQPPPEHGNDSKGMQQADPAPHPPAPWRMKKQTAPSFPNAFNPEPHAAAMPPIQMPQQQRPETERSVEPKSTPRVMRSEPL